MSFSIKPAPDLPLVNKAPPILLSQLAFYTAVNNISNVAGSKRRAPSGKSGGKIPECKAIPVLEVLPAEKRKFLSEARYYDAEIGAWTSTDPAGQFWSPYAYGGGNPIIGTDPSGMLFYTNEGDEEEVEIYREAFKAEYYDTDLWEMYQEIAGDEETGINEKIFLRAHLEYEHNEQWQWMKEQLDEMYNDKGWKKARSSETYGAEWAESFGELSGPSRFTGTEKYITYAKNKYNESREFILSNGSLQPAIKTVCHTFGGQKNTKYTYGPYELILNDTEPVSEENRATLNLINAKDGWGHGRYDVWTWVQYGTSANDPTTPVQRAYKFASGGIKEWIKNPFSH